MTAPAIWRHAWKTILTLLFAMTFIMAMPPPDIFINVKAARMKDAKTLEVTFDHPTCEKAESIGTRLSWAAYDEDKSRRDYKEYSLELLELRLDTDVATCTGPVTEQKLGLDLKKLIPDKGVTRGAVHLNYEPLYGYQKKLSTFRVPFDLNGK